MSWSWLHDSFNRTATTSSLGTADTGQAWTANYGTLGVNASGRCYCPAASGGGRSYIDPAMSDYTITVTLVTRDSSSEMWLHFRTATPGASFWRFGAFGGGQYVLQKFNGTTTVVSSSAVTPASGDAIEVDCSGSTITVKVNGSTLYSGTDTFNQTATQIGIELFSTGTNGNILDDLDVPAVMVAAGDFGIYVPTNTEIDAYYGTSRKDRFVVPDAHASGSNLAIAAWYDPTHVDNSNHTADTMIISIDKVEVYDAPGGTLLLSDDFTSLAGWSLGIHGSAWINSPASYATVRVPQPGVDGSALLYQAMPAGARYLRLLGVQFSSLGGDASWAMGLLHTAGGSTDTPFHDTSSNPPPYYRLFMQRPGSANNARPDMASGTAAQPVNAPDETGRYGWSVGTIRIR